MSNNIKYRVKPIDVLKEIMLKECHKDPIYITTQDLVYKGFGFSRNMWALCGQEIKNITKQDNDLWFCRGLGYKWHEDWVEPIVDVITEDINE